MNVSRACIIIPAGYVCVVRYGTAQDQPFQGWGFGGMNSISYPFLPIPSLLHTMAHTTRVMKKFSKIVLGLEVESRIRDNPSLRVTNTYL